MARSAVKRHRPGSGARSGVQFSLRIGTAGWCPDTTVAEAPGRWPVIARCWRWARAALAASSSVGWLASLCCCWGIVSWPYSASYPGWSQGIARSLYWGPGAGLRRLGGVCCLYISAGTPEVSRLSGPCPRKALAVPQADPPPPLGPWLVV
jgi:hypothetical protein